MIVEEVDLVIASDEPRVAWGWYLGAGIAWFLLGIGLLSWNPTAIASISIAVAIVVILAGVAELAAAFLAHSWRWLHAIAGLIFLVAGVMALFKPFHTFVGLAMLFGWYLLFKGMIVLILALATREPGTLWGLAAVVGAIDLIIGLWAIGYPGRSAWLLVLWVGIGALLHGISDIVEAFRVRAAR